MNGLQGNMPFYGRVTMPTGEVVLRADVLRSLLDHETVGIAVLRPVGQGDDFVLAYVNAAFQALKQHVPALGRRYSEVWPEVAKRFVPLMRGVLETGAPWTEQDLALQLEREPGVMSTGYFTFQVTRLEIDGEWNLLSEVQETTGEVEAEQQAKRELETTRLLLRASQALTERVELQHVLRKLAEVLLRSTSHRRSFVFSWNEATRTLTRAASAGVEAFPAGQTFSFDDVSEVTKQVILRRRTAVVDFDALPEEQRGRALAAQRSHVLVVVPVVWQDRLVGLIGVDDPDERREFTKRETELVEGIAAQAAVAIENARLFEERAEALRALEEKDRAIRQAYTDVIDAVTGGRLIILGPDELDEALETQGAEYELRDPADLSEARRRLRQAVDHDARLRDDLVLAFSEGATNMLKHAHGGTYRIGADRQCAQVVLSDDGPGIDFHDLPKATLVPGFSTQQTLGMGFTVMMELTDRLLLCTDSGGTTLVLEKDLLPSSPGEGHSG